MAYFAIFDKTTGVIEKVIECPEFLVDRIEYTEQEEIAMIPFEAKDTDYLIIGDELVKIEKTEEPI